MSVCVCVSIVSMCVLCLCVSIYVCVVSGGRQCMYRLGRELLCV